MADTDPEFDDLDFVNMTVMPNNTSAALSSVWIQHASWTYVWYIIHITISQAGGVGHLLVMGVLLLEKRLRVGSGGLVLHLVLTEYLVCGVWMPVAAIVSDWAQRENLTIEPVCPFLQLGLLTTSQAGYWTSFFLAINRFMAAKLPHLYPRLTSRPIILLMIAISWTIGLTTTVPLFADHGGFFAILPPWRSCGVRVTSVPVRTTAQAFGVYIPFAGSVILYSISVVLLQRQKRRVGGEIPGVSRKVQERRLIIAKMLLVSTLVHGVSYVPGVLLSAQFRYVSVRYPLVDLWTRTLFLSAYASQPLIRSLNCYNTFLEMEQLRGPIEHMGFQMLHAGMGYVDEAEGPNQNFVVGTFATASAAGLIYVGSGGKATHRLAKLLHFDTLFESRCTPELITIAFRQAVSALTKRPDHHFPMKEQELHSRFQLVLAHRVFFRKGINITTEFYNNAKAFSLDVGEIEGMSDEHDLEKLRVQINTWVKKNTRGQITEALPPLALVDHQEALTNMFMISVNSLRASWQTPFSREDVHPGTFHNLNGSEATINFITCPAVHLPYFEDKKANIKYVELPYTNNEASLCFCMPYDSKKATMADMVKRLKYGELKSIGWRKRLRKVDLKMPIFEVEHVFNLKDFFERIGVEDPKEDDLSHMVSAPLHSFRLTGAYHKCTFGINEHGTCAEFFDKKKTSENPIAHDEEDHTEKPRPRANSVIVAPVRRKLRSAMPEPVQFHANRPFIFAIRHNASGMLLFCGRVVDLTPLPEEDTARAKPSSSEDSVVTQGRTTVEDRSEARTLFQRTRDWLADEKGFIGRKRTGTM